VLEESPNTFQRIDLPNSLCENPPRRMPSILNELPWVAAATLALAAGYTDWRSRRIPNWLTVPGLLAGLTANALAAGWPGTKDSLLGAGLGLALLLPFVVIRVLGAGDWKLVGALGACLGLHHLPTVLLAAVLVNGAVAIAMIIRKRRVIQTMRNFAHMLAAVFSLHLPGPALTLDNPEAVKVPFGVAVAVAVVLYTVRHAWGYS
jgi:prepilin peptidase CpaA